MGIEYQSEETTIHCNTVVQNGSSDRNAASFKLASTTSSPNQHAGQCLLLSRRRGYGRFADMDAPEGTYGTGVRVRLG